MLRYRNHKLFVDQVPVDQIAETVGTPVYIYSHSELLKNFRAYRTAFQSVPYLLCYAVKANSNLSLLRLLAKEGSGADIVSGGELYLALKAGFPPDRIVFAGVGKTDLEIEEALRANLLSFHVESEQELIRIDEIAGRLRRKGRISFRVNPDIDAQTHPYISTGLRKHKFGIPIRKALSMYRNAAKLEHIDIEGLHMHLGSQISGVRPFSESIQKALHLVDQLQAIGIVLRDIDIGGGLSVFPNNTMDIAHPRALADAILPLLKGRKLRLILEPGRSIVASAGVLLTRVLYTKENDRKRFVIVDAGMNDFIRPALYGADHPVIPAQKRGRPKLKQDIVGPVCESGDFFARDHLLQACNPGELLTIENAGAYGFSMSSNYNSRPRPAEVLVHGRTFEVIRKRETYRDL